jgi:hypothetical protein
MSACSPHYSRVLNQFCGGSRRDPSVAKLEAALQALRMVAGNDPDHARTANGMGFAKSDVTKGHRFAAMQTHHFHGRSDLSREASALAARYRRQVPQSLRVELGLTDQHDLFE